MLNYTISGTGKEDLVLLHGFMEDLTIWDEMEQKLSKNFRIIKIDLPGHGKSETLSNTSMETMAEKVKEVLDHLETSELHILGHSMGGYVSLAFAEQFPKDLKSLTLFFSTVLADDEEKKETRRKSLKMIEENLEAYVDASIPGLFSEYERDLMEEKISLAKKIALATNKQGAKNAQLAMAERPDRTEILDKLDAKILIIAGKHDNAVKTDALMNSTPNKTNIKTYILDCGHNGYWEKPAICAEIINTELLHNLPKHLIF